MRIHRAVLFWALCLFGVITACGDSADVAAPSSAGVTGCADLADRYVEITGGIIDQIGDRTDADMETPPANLEAAAEEWMQDAFEIAARVDELCGGGEFDQLLCDRRSTIAPKGEAGQRFLRDNFPTCSQQPPEVTTLPRDG